MLLSCPSTMETMQSSIFQLPIARGKAKVQTIERQKRVRFSSLQTFYRTKNPSFIGYHTTPPQYQPSAIEILRQRYARGEINEETFQQMQERLGASTPPEQQQHF